MYVKVGFFEENVQESTLLGAFKFGRLRRGVVCSVCASYPPAAVPLVRSGDGSRWSVPCRGGVRRRTRICSWVGSSRPRSCLRIITDDQYLRPRDNTQTECQSQQKHSSELAFASFEVWNYNGLGTHRSSSCAVGGSVVMLPAAALRP